MVVVPQLVVRIVQQAPCLAAEAEVAEEVRDVPIRLRMLADLTRHRMAL